jgi:hypothetical protein
MLSVGKPIVGAVAGVTGLQMAGMYPAVRLAPALGQLIARQRIDGSVEPG